MQFTQPGFYNYGYGQPFALNNPFHFNGYPEVVGEGNVTSVMSPDGSMQLLFLPTTQWWQPYPCNITTGNVNNPNWNPTGAWFIRSVYSPLQQPMPCQMQPFQTASVLNNGIAFPRTNNSSECCVSQPVCPPPNFELKFHYDNCTSTSDIHYFYPSLRACEWLQKPKGCAQVQVDVPMVTNSVCHYEVICTKPCHCTPMDATENTAKSTKLCSCKPNTAKTSCSCRKTSNTSFSDMSCETDNSEKECINECHKHKGKKTRKDKKKCKPTKKTSSKVVCECKEQKTTDKCVTTYADQACGCAADKGRETQTTEESIPVRMLSGDECKKQTKVEMWTPKTPTSKKALKIKSSENFSGVCESGCSSGICNCNSETD